MEEIGVAIKEFLEIGSGYGYGYGSGYGSGSGDGSGDGYGSGDGSGSGYGSGYGYGSGDGSGYGYGDGSGYGYGSGSGDGSGVTYYGKNKVFLIDGVQTIIETVHGNIAKGYILQSNFTLVPCYVVKENNLFAHGDTLHDAMSALQEKLYDNSSEEERIEVFVRHFPDFSKKYPARELFTWHHVLTGSCRFGRKNFCREHGIDVENGMFTIYEFIDMTENEYGGETIKKLKNGQEYKRRD